MMVSKSFYEIADLFDLTVPDHSSKFVPKETNPKEITPKEIDPKEIPPKGIKPKEIDPKEINGIEVHLATLSIDIRACNLRASKFLIKVNITHRGNYQVMFIPQTSVV